MPLKVVPNLNNADARIVAKLLSAGVGAAIADDESLAQLRSTFTDDVPINGWTAPELEEKVHLAAYAIAYEYRKKKWVSGELSADQVQALASIAKDPRPYLEEYIGHDDIRPARKR